MSCGVANSGTTRLPHRRCPGVRRARVIICVAGVGDLHWCGLRAVWVVDRAGGPLRSPVHPISGVRGRLFHLLRCRCGPPTVDHRMHGRTRPLRVRRLHVPVVGSVISPLCQIAVPKPAGRFPTDTRQACRSGIVHRERIDERAVQISVAIDAYRMVASAWSSNACNSARSACLGLSKSPPST